MDFATIIGVILALVVVGVAVVLGGSYGAFYDLPSILIVFGGAAATTLIRFPLIGVLKALAIGGKVAMVHRRIEARELVDQIATCADVLRRQGPLGLEEVEIEHPQLAKGLQMIADGFETAVIREFLEKDRDQYLGELEEGARVFKALGDSAPAFGMIGTLVGLVQMLANMSDPKAIGPAMAVALLTTLYGAVIANVVCLPIYEKLGAKAKSEDFTLQLVIDGICMLRENRNPQVVREMLLAYLPAAHRDEAAVA